MKLLAIDDMSDHERAVGFLDEESVIGENEEDLGGVRVPVLVLSVHGEGATDGVRLGPTTRKQKDDSDGVLPLPASKFRYSRWHEVNTDVETRGDMLRSPRVRKGPRAYRPHLVNLLDGGDQDSDAEDEATLFRQVQLQLKKKEIKRKYSQSYRNKLENWENCESINLSFQDLGHNYQRREFFRVLRRLVRCQHIQLMDNSLGDMSAIIFPRCTELYLQRNFVNHFKKLPAAPMLEHLSLQQNNIKSLDHITVLNKTKIKSLVLKDNPVCLEPMYRKMVFHLLPNLQLLDGVPKLDSDEMDIVEAAKTCCIC